jgi:hypothetical protein
MPHYIEERSVVVCNAALAVVEPGPSELDQVLGLIERAPDATIVCNAALAVVEPGPSELDQVLGLIERAPDATIGDEPELVRARAKDLARAVLEQCNAERDQRGSSRT